MKHKLTFLYSLIFVLSTFSYLSAQVAGGGPFHDSFDSYIAGQLLACQNPTDWTTWNNLPCDPIEDAYISTNYALSPPNSVVIGAGTDLIKLLGNQTRGIHEIRFYIYIPSGKNGYFNTLAGFTPDPYNWAMDCYFYDNGVGTVHGGGASADFNFSHDTWHLTQLIVDLDADQAQFLFNGSLIHSWQWTLGIDGGGSPLKLAAVDYNGVSGYEMYIDEFSYGDYPVPVELTSFTAYANRGVVSLSWVTATETNNHLFEIERRTAKSDYMTIGFVEGAGTTTESRSYSYIDRTAANVVNFYRLKQIDFDGAYTYSDEVTVNITGPLTFNLEQNYPNPFNPTTTIGFGIQNKSNVKITILNAVGEEVGVLLNKEKEAGYHQVEFRAVNLPSGVYFYQIRAGDFIQTKKMILLK